MKILEQASTRAAVKPRFESSRHQLEENCVRTWSLPLRMVPDLRTSVYILERIAGDPWTHPTLLKKLCNYPSIRVKEALVDNPSSPPAVLSRLASDPNVDIRYALAENHNVPYEFIMQLCNDENPYVAQRAQKTLARLNS